MAFWGREGPQAALPAFSRPAFSRRLRGRPRTCLHEVAVGRVLGVCRQCPHWDAVAEGWGRCPLSARLGRLTVCGRLAGRGQAACLTAALGAGVSSGRGRPRTAGLPRPEVAQRKGHIPVSVMPGMRLPTPGQGGAFLGAGGWGRGWGRGSSRPSPGDPEGSGERLRRASPCRAEDQVCQPAPSSQGPASAQAGMKGGGPGKMCPPPWQLRALPGKMWDLVVLG